MPEAKEYIARFDRHYAKVRAFQDEQLRLAHEQGFIVTIAGRRWPIGDLESLDPQLRSYAERLARRATHEASVQDVSRRALLEADRAIEREGLGTLPVLQILDEVLFDVPEAELEKADPLTNTPAGPVDPPGDRPEPDESEPGEPETDGPEPVETVPPVGPALAG